MRKSVMVLIMIITIMVGLSSCTKKQPNNDSLSVENLKATKIHESNSINQKEIDVIESSTIKDKVELVMYDQKLSEGLSSVMRKRMPEVTFSYLHGEESGYSYESEEIVQRLLSGDDSFDVYLISSKSDFALSILNKGLFVDISTYPEMNATFDNMYPSFVEASTWGGELFGLPNQILSNGLLMYPRSHMEKIDWSLEQLKTIDDLLMFDMAWGQSNQDNKSVAVHKSMVMDQIVFRYIYNHYDYMKYYINLDDAAFKDVLIDAKNLYESDIVHDDYLYLENYDYVLLGTIMPFSHNSEYLTLPQVKNQNDKNVLYTSWLVINPNSKNIDTAVDMLSRLAEFNRVEQVNSNYMDEDVEYTKRISKLYQEHQLFFAFSGESQVRAIFISYLNGDIVLEDAIVEAQYIINMKSQEHRAKD